MGLGTRLTAEAKELEINKIDKTDMKQGLLLYYYVYLVTRSSCPSSLLRLHEIHVGGFQFFLRSMYMRINRIVLFPSQLALRLHQCEDVS